MIITSDGYICLKHGIDKNGKLFVICFQNEAIYHAYPIDKDNDRDTVINKFEEYLINEIVNNNRDIINGLRKLNKDSTLVCFHKNNSS